MLISRTMWVPNCTVWPGSFRTPLLSIPVPLEPPDPDVTLTLSLQPLIDAIYERAPATSATSTSFAVPSQAGPRRR